MPRLYRGTERDAPTSYTLDSTQETLKDMSDTRAILCPYCGDRQVPSLQCRACGGLFDVWSLHATQNEMGAWFVRDPRRPHFVGFGYEALCAAIRNGEVGRDAIVRGPTTRQLWTLARRTPGLAHLFGRCAACQSPMQPDDAACGACGATTSIDQDRNFFGLPVVEPISPPAGAKADLSAFVLDAGLLVVRSVPVRSPARTVVRVAQPIVTAQAEVNVPSTEFVPDFARGASAASGMSPTNHSESPAYTARTSKTGDSSARSALSPIDRGLIERSRRLEARNMMLLGATVGSLAFALLFGFAYFLEKDDRQKAIEAARREGAEGVRSEFKRSEPVVVPPPAELPAMPNDPGASTSASGRASKPPATPPATTPATTPANPSATVPSTAPAVPPAPAFNSQPSPRRNGE